MLFGPTLPLKGSCANMFDPIIRGESRNNTTWPLMANVKITSDVALMPWTSVNRVCSEFSMALKVTFTCPVPPVIMNELLNRSAVPWELADTNPMGMVGMFTVEPALSTRLTGSASACPVANWTNALVWTWLPMLELKFWLNPPRLFCACAKTSALHGSVKTTLPLAGVMVRLVREMDELESDSARSGGANSREIASKNSGTTEMLRWTQSLDEGAAKRVISASKML